jgi:hypothetical protein
MLLVSSANRRDIIQIYAQKNTHPNYREWRRPKRLEDQREDTIWSGQLGSNCIQLLLVIYVERGCKNNGQTVLNKVFMSFS